VQNSKIHLNSCNPNFIKLYSLTDINECSPDSCKNGATCKDLVNEYKCTCVAGYDGKNCDISKFARN
jgi:Notch-like protein